MNYFPKNTPANPGDLPNYLKDELQSIASALVQPAQVLLLAKSYAAPAKLREGMVVLADGTKWNPGSGAGYYGYRNGAWAFLG